VELPTELEVPDALLEWPILFLAVILAVGFLLGWLLGRVSRGLLEAAGVPEAVEGTPFERSARSIGTSTVSIVSRMLSWFVYGVTVLTAVNAVRPADTEWIWKRIAAFVPHVFVAVLVVVVGFVVADKAELLVGERLRDVKVPQATIIPRVVKYSVLYVAFLVALSQIGVATAALLVLLAVYVFAVVVFGAVATKDLLSSGAAGIYLLLYEPYGIGDEVEIVERAGVVQEVGLLVTRLETDEAEFVVPNSDVFEHGVKRQRN